MSAVLGIYYLDGQPLERTNLERMADILAHRGPDGAGIWNRGSLGLGHRMLLTTAESLYERLPLVNRTGNLVLTADARLDNRAELIDALNFTDRLPEQITDGEIILAAYEKWEEQCPEKFLGDFAFAIWDERKQTLFCARDHFGVRSFYYYTSARFFAFASEIKALFCLAEVPRRLNENKVAEYLASIFNESSATFYEGVLRLPPSHSLTIGHEGITIRSYWSLNPSQELHLASNESYTESFRELFIEAVRCRLRSAFPVGSLLSGGLDSSSITCVAQQLLSQNDGGPLPTFQPSLMR